MTEQANKQAEARLCLPWDLSEWVSKEQLREWVAEAVGSLDWDVPAMVRYLQGHKDAHPQILLTLVTFAYLTGRFESEDITTGCFADQHLRDICRGHAAPSAMQIGRFRRENRGLLRWLLVQVFVRAIRSQLKTALVPAGLRRLLEESASERLDLARHMDRAVQGA